MSQTAQTYVRKNIRGNWEAVTEVPHDTTPDGKQRILRFYTSKSSSGALYTGVTVQTVDRGMMSHMMFQDYSRTIEQSRERCTAKAVEAMHVRALGMLETIKADAVQHYEKQVNE